MSDENKRNTDGDLKTRDRVKKPRMWQVMLHNDDYTTMEFVVYLLQSVFRHSPASASRVMLLVHKAGVGTAGTYTREIAETRMNQVLQMARKEGHPLQCTMEPE
jgi:ATP-dependent Clp protease adaptor protein ClpS